MEYPNKEIKARNKKGFFLIISKYSSLILLRHTKDSTANSPMKRAISDDAMTGVVL